MTESTDKLSPDVAGELMRRLTSNAPDDLAFRWRFQKDPYSALLEIPGYDEPHTAATVLSRLAGKALKSPEDLASIRDELEQKLVTASLCQKVHSFTVDGDSGDNTC